MKRPLTAIAVVLTLSLLAARAGTGLRSLGAAAHPAAAVVLPAPDEASALDSAHTLQTATFAGGCFWGVEGVFEHLKGVKSATAGYAGGTAANPSYEDVSSGETGHAESVRVTYDPAVISYGQLLQVFFSVAHDPTTLDRQGPDRGTQYRSAIFYENEAQKRAAEAYVAQLARAKTFADPIVTQIAPLRAFHEAEGYHQHYMELHPTAPYIVYNDAPKVQALKKQFPGLWRDSWS